MELGFGALAEGGVALGVEAGLLVLALPGVEVASGATEGLAEEEREEGDGDGGSEDDEKEGV